MADDSKMSPEQVEQQTGTMTAVSIQTVQPNMGMMGPPPYGMGMGMMPPPRSGMGNGGKVCCAICAVIVVVCILPVIPVLFCLGCLSCAAAAEMPRNP